MRQARFKLAALTAAALLAACGGGGSSNTATVSTTVTPASVPTLTGIAATGAALANANVTAKCITGPAITGKTGADGSFTLAMTGGQSAPCLLEVSNGTVTLHSVATEAGRVNVTTLTELVVGKALGSDPTAAFASFDAAKGFALKNGLDAAKAYVKAQATALAGSAPSTDLMTGAFQIGDGDDKILDKLSAALLAGGKTLDDLRLSAAGDGSLDAALKRGSLIDPAAVVTTLTKAQIDAGTASGLQALSGKAACDVKVVALNYNTIGVKGEAANASGVLLVPAGTCTAAAGLIAYAKGTDVQKPRTLANPADPETFLLAAMYAAQGYAVVATDYLGFAKSTYAYHPYLHADSEASSMVDAIRAARNAAKSSTVNAALTGKVMVTGYSQGGHASAATHRAIERDHAKEINLVAGAHLAGPYNLSGSIRSTTVIAGYQYFVPYIITSWQKVYGNIYSKITDVFKSPYSDYIETLLPNPTLTFDTLATTGKLPGGSGETPTQARDAMFQSAFIADLPTNYNSALYKAATLNDLTGWNPKAQTLLCGAAGDPTVSPAVHQIPTKAAFDSRGLTNVSSVDVDASIQFVYGAPPSPATDLAGYVSYYSNYHGVKEPQFCHAAARQLFNAVTRPPT